MKIVIIGAMLVLAGCQNSNMSDFEWDNPRVMTDADGKQYVVEHHMGNVYTVKPVKQQVSP